MGKHFSSPFCHFFVWGMVFSLCLPTSVLGGVPTISQDTLGISRVGIWSFKEMAAYPNLARKVQQWVENVDNSSLRVSRDNTFVKNEQLRVDEVLFELRKTTEKLKETILTSKTQPNLETTVELILKNRKQVSRLSNAGPDIQSSLFWEGAYYWMQGREKLGQKAIERAVKIHPAGVLPVIQEWDNNDKRFFNADAFESFVDQVKAKLIRNCNVNIDIEPSDAQIWVNGFKWASKPSLLLAPEVSHHVEVVNQGYHSQKYLVSCHKLETKKIVARLEKIIPKNNQDGEVNGDNQKSEVAILMKPHKEHLKLFLYSPGEFLEEIPLTHSVRIAQSEMSGLDESNPINSDAMLQLLKKHELLASNAHVPRLDPLNIAYPFAAQSKMQAKEPAWFESPVFWGIVGGLLVGGGITYFATQDKSSGTTSSDWD